MGPRLPRSATSATMGDPQCPPSSTSITDPRRTSPPSSNIRWRRCFMNISAASLTWSSIPTSRTFTTALHTKVRVREFGDDLATWTRHQLFGHRAKICVLIDALSVGDDYCVLLDSDTFIRRGFADAIARVMEGGGVAMDEFERADPFPRAAGFVAELPHFGRYAYDGAAARMYNAGLVGVPRKHLPMLEDALVLVDALLDAGFRSIYLRADVVRRGVSPQRRVRSPRCGLGASTTIAVAKNSTCARASRSAGPGRGNGSRSSPFSSRASYACALPASATNCAFA